MATLNYPLIITDTVSNRVQMNICQYQNQGDQTPKYIHMKTNIARYSSVMYMIEAIGYNYGMAQSVRCAFTGYMYDDGTRPGITIYNPTQFTNYPGLTADGQYLSTDNYLCLRLYAASVYYCGFVLNVYQPSPVSTQASVGISGFITTTSSGAQY
jgi:hypothetical protein